MWRVAGPVTITFGGVSLGPSGREGCVIRPQTDLLPVMDDAHGAMPADFIVGGRSAVVECVLVDVVAVKAAAPWIGELLAYTDATDVSQIGKLIWTGDETPGSTGLGKELVITERDGTSVWTAKYAAPTDPSQLLLSSIREQQIPIAFVLVPDENLKIFSTLPNYMTT